MAGRRSRRRRAGYGPTARLRAVQGDVRTWDTHVWGWHLWRWSYSQRCSRSPDARTRRPQRYQAARQEPVQVATAPETWWAGRTTRARRAPTRRRHGGVGATARWSPTRVRYPNGLCWRALGPGVRSRYPGSWDARLDHLESPCPLPAAPGEPPLEARLPSTDGPATLPDPSDPPSSWSTPSPPPTAGERIAVQRPDHGPADWHGDITSSCHHSRRPRLCWAGAFVVCWWAM